MLAKNKIDGLEVEPGLLGDGLLGFGTGISDAPDDAGPSGDALLLESGDYLLLESGDFLLLE
jgi:hypothetical protein